MKLPVFFVLILSVIFCKVQASDTLVERFLKAPEWREAVQTPEDYDRLRFFVTLTEKNTALDKPVGEIPKVFHVIWLGPHPLPNQSISSLKSWQDQHPEWKIKFWTDQNRDAPLASMQVCTLEDFPLEDFTDCYYNADSYEERSLVLRYAILLNEGGIYIEHDAECLKSLDGLRAENDFFCGLETPGPSIRSSSINPSYHLLASTPHHPILASAKQWLLAHWQEYEELFPGTDPICAGNRAIHRSGHALSLGIQLAAAQGSRKDAIFPPHFFSAASKDSALYAMQPAKSLFGRVKESQAQQNIQNALLKMRGDLRVCFILIFVLAAINIILGFVIFYMYKKWKRP